jgi:hypothetical protein
MKMLYILFVIVHIFARTFIPKMRKRMFGSVLFSALLFFLDENKYCIYF